MTTLIKNGLIVTGENVFAADILVKNGKIAEIAAGITKVAEETVDATGRYVLPGGVDAAVHLSRAAFGTVTSDDFASGTRAAACGGTTTVMGYVFAMKGSYKRGVDDWVRKAQGQSFTDFACHLTLSNCTERALGEIPSIVKGGVTSFIAYFSSRSMGVSEGQLYAAFRAVEREKGIVGVHVGSGTLTQALEQECVADNRGGPEAHSYCRPPHAEAFSANTALTLAEMTGTPMVLLHLSSAHSLEKLKVFHDRGNPVYGETCPHYLVLSEDKAFQPEELAERFVCSPPLRNEWHMEALWRGIRSGDIHFISSDHMPIGLEDRKEGKKDFRKIPSGLPGVERRLSLLYHYGVTEGRISLTRMVQLLSTHPAKLFGMYPQKGGITIGGDADLVVFNPEGRTAVGAGSHHMNVDYDPYEGQELRGAVERVLLRGKHVVKDGQPLEDPAEGAFVARALPALI